MGGLIALSRLALTPAIGDKSPFFLAAPSMIVAAFLGGFWPTIAVGVIGFGVGEMAATSRGGPGLTPVGVVVYAAFTVVFAAAGGMRRRGMRRAKADAARLAEMQDRLVKVARLNAMGEIAGALAHELNQPLTAIASYAGAAQLMVRQKSGAGELDPLLEKISDQSVRAREIIGRIRGQVSGGDVDPQPESLTKLCHEAVAVGAVGDQQLSVLYELDPSADRVLVDGIQVQQVVVNLVRNAAEAMHGLPKRVLRIGSQGLEGGLVEVQVADCGPGIDAAIAERLFDPFVSGKSEGLGIGLAVSRSIIEAHGGRLWAENIPQGGAVFRFTLRRALEEAPA